jgi:hypothetical protein
MAANRDLNALFPALEIVCQGAPGRQNEDTWLAMQAGPSGEQIVIAAIDGATTRLTPPPLQRRLDAQPEKPTPAAYAARLTRDSLARQIGTSMPAELRTLLLEANADLGRDLMRLFGALTLDAMGFPEEVYTPLADDPRMVRLGLPASVVTLAEYDPASRTLRYAHAGDGLLLVVYRDGRVSVPTHADGSGTDHALKQTALQMHDYYPDLSFRELVELPEVQHRNLTDALYHNYVDEHGLPQPSRGVGVIDGLPELRYFIRAGQVALDDAVLACVMTDGLEWPASAQESFADDPAEVAELCEQRYRFMGEQIGTHGLAGYLDRLREAETGDPDHERYPRMKTHDDATGVLLRLA